MAHTAKATRQNRTITVDFQDEATYFQLLDEPRRLSSSSSPSSSPSAFSSTTRRAVATVGVSLATPITSASVWAGSPSGAFSARDARRYSRSCPILSCAIARCDPRWPGDALLATHGGLSLEWCATICHISPMALYRVICAFGQHSLVSVLTRCGLRLPAYILADEKHSRCLTAKVYLPTIVSGRVLWHLGYSDAKSAAAFTQSYGVFQQAALEQEPSYRVKGALTDGFDSTVSSMRTLFPGARLGFCLRHALNKLPNKLVGVSASVRQGLRSKFHALLHRCRQRKSLRVVAMGQCLRHFANRIATTVGEAHGERVRHWFEDKKAGWYAVLEDPQMPAMSTMLDQAHNAIDRKLFAMKGFPSSRRESSGVSRRPGAPLQPDPLSAPGPQCGQVWGGSGRRSRADIGLDAQPADPHLRRLPICAWPPHH